MNRPQPPPSRPKPVSHAPLIMRCDDCRCALHLIANVRPSLFSYWKVLCPPCADTEAAA